MDFTKINSTILICVHVHKYYQQISQKVFPINK